MQGLEQPSAAARIFKLLHTSGLGNNSLPDGRKVWMVKTSEQTLWMA
jgi:hypothetical protein